MHIYVRGPHTIVTIVSPKAPKNQDSSHNQLAVGVAVI